MTGLDWLVVDDVEDIIIGSVAFVETFGGVDEGPADEDPPAVLLGLDSGGWEEPPSVVDCGPVLLSGGED